MSNLSASQRSAVDYAIWRLTAPIDQVAAKTEPHGNPYETRLVGPAGSGKTKSLLEILDGLDAEADRGGFDAFGAYALMGPTWRSAREIEKATGRPASSCHKQFYGQPATDEAGELVFNAFNNADDRLRWAVMDEASMIGSKLATDSRNWAHRQHNPEAVGGSRNAPRCAPPSNAAPVRRLIVGDKAQLSPVNDTWGFDLDHAECELTEVFRQALDSPILDFATRWREGRLTAWTAFDRWTPGVCECFGRGAAPATSKFAGLAGADKLVAKVLEASQTAASQTAAGQPSSVVICWTNSERETINHIWRRRIGMPAGITNGDRLLSFSNFGGVCNGDLIDVEAATDPFAASYRSLGMKPPKKGGSLALRQGFPAVGVRIDGFPDMESMINPSRLPDGLPRQLDGMTHLVAVDSDRSAIPRRMEGRWAYYTQREIPLLDAEFGYAITCHKSQGSTFDFVGVVNPSGMSDPDEYQRWVYTAATRPRHGLFLMV